MCPYARKHVSSFYQVYVPMRAIGCPYVYDMCPYGIKHMSLYLLSYVLTLCDMCPYGVNHMSLYL